MAPRLSVSWTDSAETNEWEGKKQVRQNAQSSFPGWEEEMGAIPVSHINPRAGGNFEPRKGEITPKPADRS